MNGKEVSSRTIDVSCVSPRGEKTVAIPDAAIEANKPGNSVSVRYEFIAKESEGFIEKGYVVANDQIDLPNDKRAQALGMKLMDMMVRKEDGRVEFLVPTGGVASVAFDRATGALVSYKVKGVERLLAPMVLDAYRRSGASAAGATSDRRRFPSARSGETTTTRTRSRSRWRWSAGERPRSRWSTTGGLADTSRRRARRRVSLRRTSAPSCAGASAATSATRRRTDSS